MRGKRGKSPKLEIVSASESEPQVGVFEDLDAFAGTYVLNVYDASGRRIGRWEAIAGKTDDPLCDAFFGFGERLRSGGIGGGIGGKSDLLRLT